MGFKKALIISVALVFGVLSFAIFIILNIDISPDSEETLIYTTEEKHTLKTVVLDESSVELTEILDNKTILYIGKVSKSIICYVTADFDENNEYINKCAVFYDTSKKKLVERCTLPDKVKYYHTASGHFFAAENTLSENAVVYDYSFDGTLQNSFIFNTGFSADKYFEEYMKAYYPDFATDTADLSDEMRNKEYTQIKESAFSGSELLNIFFCWSSDGESLFYNEIYGTEIIPYKVNLKNSEKERFVYDDTMLRHFVGCSEDSYLTYYTEDGSTVVELCSLNGTVQKKWSYGSYKRCTSNGNYAVIYNYNDNQEVSPSVTVLNLQTGKDADVTLKTKPESYWAKVSEDGKVLLTFDKIGTFRLYDVKTGHLLSEFEVAYAVNVTENIVCIDTENSFVYIAIQNGSEFGIAAINY